MADIFDEVAKQSATTDIFDEVASKSSTKKKSTNDGDVIDGVPKWGRENPNLYGAFGAGRELLRTGIETTGSTGGAAAGALIPFPGTSLVGGGLGYAASKRVANKILGEETDNSLSSIGKDVASGVLQTGAGKLISKLPFLNKVLSPSSADIGTTPIGGKSLNKLAYSVMEKSMKIPPSGNVGGVLVSREKAINTALNEGTRITKGSLNRVKGVIDDLGEQMDETIKTTPNANNLIRTDDVLTPVYQLKDRMGMTVNGLQLQKKIQKVVDNFKKQYGDEITVADAQAIKQNTNAFLKKSYGELKTETVEAQKQIVRGLKDRIAQEVPEITGLNLKYGEMKNLERVLERAVNRTGNWDFMSLSSLLVGSTIGGATGKVATASEAATLMRILKSPAVQSQIAISLKRLGAGSKANAMSQAIADSLFNKMRINEGSETLIESDE